MGERDGKTDDVGGYRVGVRFAVVRSQVESHVKGPP